jgi:competence protein ComEA
VHAVTDDEEFWNPRRHQELDAARAPRQAARDTLAPRPPAPGVLERFIDRVHDWRTDARVGVAVLVVVAVVAGVVWYRVGLGGGDGASAASPGSQRIEARAVAGATTSTTTPPSTNQGRITVHVAGAVARPGVVALPAGARVIDAVEAVGGAPTDADLDRLNLAAKVVDGERVFVPKVGQADPGVVAGSTDGTGSSSASSTASAKLDLNAATQTQLETLPGIGPSYAQAIIAERQRRGGFKAVNELRSVRGIGEKRFAEIAPLVTV